MNGAATQFHSDFVGGWAGTAPLTWGQRHIWEQIGRLAPDDHFLNSSYPFRLPHRSSDEWVPGRAPTPAMVTRALADLVAMYESLRTRFRLIDGEPRQVVQRIGRVGAEVVLSTAERAEAAAQAAQIRLHGTPFDHANDLPVRACLIVVDGSVAWVVLCVSHLAADGWATQILLRQLRCLIVRGTAPLAPGLQPVDLTRQQCAGVAQPPDRARVHWADAWRRIPPATVIPRHAAAAVPFLRLGLHSPALTAASRLVAIQQRVSDSTVLLAATAGRVAAWTGQHVCAMAVHSSNRYRSAFATAVGTMSQKGVLVLDLADRPPFGDLVRRAFLASLTAYRNAYYDQAAVDAELARICRDRQVEVDPSCCFNDARSIAARDPVGPLPTAADVRAALAATRIGPTIEQPARVDCRFCLEVRDAPAGQLSIALTADTRCFSPDEMATLLRELEHDVVQAAVASAAHPARSS